METIGCFAGVLYFLLLPVSYALSGLALSTLWGWFVTPTFDLPVLSIPVAIGLATIVGYMTNHTSAEDSSRKKTKEENLSYILYASFYAIFRPLFALLTGWIVYQFV